MTPLLNPAELDKQSLVVLDRWMHTDSLGRIWGYDKNRNLYFPFHFEDGKKLIGYRMAKKAAN